MKLHLASEAIVLLLRNWAGLVYLGDNQVHIQSLIAALRQPSQPIFKDYILEIILNLIKPGINNLSF